MLKREVEDIAVMMVIIVVIIIKILILSWLLLLLYDCYHYRHYTYSANLRLMEELSDRSAQGRACGNLGNTHYLLGNFTQAIGYHNEVRMQSANIILENDLLMPAYTFINICKQYVHTQITLWMFINTLS